MRVFYTNSQGVYEILLRNVFEIKRFYDVFVSPAVDNKTMYDNGVLLPLPVQTFIGLLI